MCAGAASQHPGPSWHAGLLPVSAVQYLPKYESNEWFSCTISTTCLIGVAVSDDVTASSPLSAPSSAAAEQPVPPIALSAASPTMPTLHSFMQITRAHGVPMWDRCATRAILQACAAGSPPTVDHWRVRTRARVPLASAE